MFLKLLKYEWKSTYRVFVPLIAGLLGAATIARLFSFDTLGGFDVIETLFNTIFIFSAIGLSFFAFFYTVKRFQKNFMTDEAYLTFSVPAKIWQHLAVKLLFAFTWFLASIITIILAIMIRFSAFFEIFQGLAEVVSFMTGQVLAVFGIHPAVFYLLLFLIIFSGIIYSIMLLYFAITYGYSLPKLKFLAAVGIYFVGSWTNSFLISIVTTALTGIKNFPFGLLMIYYILHFIIISALFFYLVWNKFRYRINVE